jgi:hypothetical protein
MGAAGQHLHFIKARDLRAGHEVSGYGTVQSVHRRYDEDDRLLLMIWFAQRPTHASRFDGDESVAVITER